MSLKHYERAFCNLGVNRTHGRISPLKPCMLLAVLQLGEAGGLEKNEIRYTPTLLEPYNEIFQVVRTPKDNPNPYFPFFHLQGDGFWHLKPKAGREAIAAAMKSARSRPDIEQNFEYAYVYEPLYKLLQDTRSRARLRETLILHWFPDFKLQLEKVFADQTPSVLYERKLREQVAAQGVVADPALCDAPTRDRAFRRTVLEAYDYRCAASGWRIILPDSAALVQAAHLVPFSVAQDDDPRNGIALAPSHHWGARQPYNRSRPRL